MTKPIDRDELNSSESIIPENRSKQKSKSIFDPLLPASATLKTKPIAGSLSNLPGVINDLQLKLLRQSKAVETLTNSDPTTIEHQATILSDRTNVGAKLTEFLDLEQNKVTQAIFEQQFTQLLDQLIQKVNDPDLRAEIIPKLRKNFEIFNKQNILANATLTKEQIALFTKQYGSELENIQYLSEFDVFQLLPFELKRSLIYSLNQLLEEYTESFGSEQAVLANYRKLAVRKLLIDQLLQQSLDSALWEQLIASNLILNHDPKIKLDLDVITGGSWEGMKIVAAVNKLNQLLQKNIVLQNYFKQHPEEQIIMVNYLLWLQDLDFARKTSTYPAVTSDYFRLLSKEQLEYQQQIERILFKAFYSDPAIATEFQKYIKNLESKLNSTFAGTNKFDGAAKTMLIEAYMREQYLQISEISELLLFKINNQTSKQIECRWLSKQILRNFSFYSNLDLQQQNVLIENLMEQLTQPNITLTDLQIMIIQLIYDHDLKLDPLVPQEKMIYDAMQQFEKNILSQDHQVLLSDPEFKTSRAKYVNDLLECNKAYINTTFIWSKLIINLLDSKPSKLIQNISQWVIPTEWAVKIEEPIANFKDRLGISKIRAIEDSVANINEQITQSANQVFVNSKEVQDSLIQLKQRFNLEQISTHDGDLKNILEKELLGLLVNRSKYGSSQQEFDDKLELIRQKIAAAIILCNIYAFRELSIKEQLLDLQAMVDLLNSLAKSENIDDSGIQKLSNGLLMFATHAKLIDFAEQKLQLKQTNLGMWGNIVTTINNVVQNADLKLIGDGVTKFLKKPFQNITNQVFKPIKALTAPFNYLLKESSDLYYNPNKKSMLNRIIRGTTMVVATMAVAPLLLGGGIIGSTFSMFAGVAVIAGGSKLVNLGLDLIKPNNLSVATARAKEVLGEVAAQKLLDYLNTKLRAINNLLSNDENSTKDRKFFKYLKEELQQALLLIQKGELTKLQNKWQGHQGLMDPDELNPSLKANLYQLEIYQHKNKHLLNQDLIQQLDQFSRKTMVEWKHNLVVSELNNPAILNGTKEIFQNYTINVNELINIDALICEKPLTAVESSSLAELSQLKEITDPAKSQQTPAAMNDQVASSPMNYHRGKQPALVMSYNNPKVSESTIIEPVAVVSDLKNNQSNTT